MGPHNRIVVRHHTATATIVPGTLKTTEEEPLNAGDEDAHDPEHETIIRAKWTMDGASTLPEAAAKLRAFAGKLDRMAAEGWTLEDEVADDYGHCRKS